MIIILQVSRIYTFYTYNLLKLKSLSFQFRAYNECGIYFGFHRQNLILQYCITVLIYFYRSTTGNISWLFQQNYTIVIAAYVSA